MPYLQPMPSHSTFTALSLRGTLLEGDCLLAILIGAEALDSL